MKRSEELGDPSLFGDDGFHLNQNGYKTLADFIMLNLFN